VLAIVCSVGRFEGELASSLSSHNPKIMIDGESRGIIQKTCIFIFCIPHADSVIILKVAFSWRRTRHFVSGRQFRMFWFRIFWLPKSKCHFGFGFVTVRARDNGSA
jgi:hypothetical protein